MSGNKYQNDIDLGELLFKCLLRWRLLAIALIIGAIAGGGYGTYRDLSRQRQSVQQWESAQQQSTQQRPMPALNKNSMEKISQIQALEPILQTAITYCENAIIMKIDPNRVHKATVQFYICPAAGNIAEFGEETTGYDVYLSLLKEAEFYNFIANETDYKAESSYLPEAIAISQVPTHSYAYLENPSEEEIRKQKAFILQIDILHYDQVIAEEIAEAAISYVQRVKTVAQGVIGEHDVLRISSNYAQVPDTGLFSRQLAALDNRDRLVNMLKARIDALSAYETAFLLEADLEGKVWMENMLEVRIDALKAKIDTLPEGEAAFLREIAFESAESSPEQAAPSPVSISSAIRAGRTYFLLGAVLGVLMIVAIVAIRYIFSKTLKEIDDFHALYGIYVLGDIHASFAAGSKKPLSGVDRWLLRHRYGKCFQSASMDSLVACICVYIEAFRRKHQLESLILIGDGLCEAEWEIMEKIEAYFAQTYPLNISTYQHLTNDPVELDKFTACENAILMETVGKSTHERIKSKLEMCDKFEIGVRGIIRVI